MQSHTTQYLRTLWAAICGRAIPCRFPPGVYTFQPSAISDVAITDVANQGGIKLD